MTGYNDYFSDSYDGARERFLETGEKLGAQHIAIPLAGAANQGLAHDYLWFGSSSPKRVLFHVAGTHGVEGFVGAAIQLAVMEEQAQQIANYISDGASAVIFLLALNPWGFKNLRRVNSANVDLNRNFIEPWAPPVASPEYVKLAGWVNPSVPSSAWRYYLEAAMLIARYGISTLKQAFAAGQVSYPRGLYFCGESPQPEAEAFKSFMQENFKAVESFNCIEVHSGLGSFGQNTIFGFGFSADEMASKSRELQLNLTSDDPKGVGIKTTGDIGRWFEANFKKPKHHWFLQEFGTFHPISMLRALRDENAAYQNGQRDGFEKRLLAAFSPPGKWREGVTEHGIQLFKKLAHR